MDMNEAKQLFDVVRSYKKPTGSEMHLTVALEWALDEIERLNIILHGSSTPAS